MSPDESKHAVKVLRLQNGDSIELIDGEGGLYHATITDNHPKRCAFRVDCVNQEPERTAKIHIAIAPTKNLDRIEWFVEKAVEIGVDEISFLLCSNSERKVLKLDRIEKKAISAMKQSLKARKPKLNDLIPYPDFISNLKGPQKFIAYVDFENPRQLQDEIQAGQSVCVLIGPEGDFSNEELTAAEKYGFKKVGLGKSRLRTETAGIVACHIHALVNN